MRLVLYTWYCVFFFILLCDGIARYFLRTSLKYEPTFGRDVVSSDDVGLVLVLDEFRQDLDSLLLLYIAARRCLHNAPPPVSKLGEILQWDKEVWVDLVEDPSLTGALGIGAPVCVWDRCSDRCSRTRTTVKTRHRRRMSYTGR